MELTTMHFAFIKSLYTFVLKTLWHIFCGVRVCIYTMSNAIPCYVHIIIVNLKIYAEPTYFPKIGFTPRNWKVLCDTLAEGERINYLQLRYIIAEQVIGSCKYAGLLAWHVTENVTTEQRLLGTQEQDLVVSCTAIGGIPAPNVALIIEGKSIPSQAQSVQYTFKSHAIWESLIRL
jgi:hypothetical protein